MNVIAFEQFVMHCGMNSIAVTSRHGCCNFFAWTAALEILFTGCEYDEM